MHTEIRASIHVVAGFAASAALLALAACGGGGGGGSATTSGTSSATPSDASTPIRRASPAPS